MQMFQPVAVPNFDNGGTAGQLCFGNEFLVHKPEAKCHQGVAKFSSVHSGGLCLVQSRCSTQRSTATRKKPTALAKTLGSLGGNRTGNKWKSHLERCGRGTPQKICEDPQSASDVQ